MLTSDFIAAPDKTSKKLMVVLHGLGDSMDGYRWMPRLLDLPWLNYLLVNAPDEYYGGFSWYDFEDSPGPGIVRSREALFSLLDAQRALGFPTGETFMFGFSQGCLMTVEIGLRYPHVLAGLIGISGYVYEPARAIRELSPVALAQRFLLTHGTQDPLIPIARVRPQVEMLKSAGLNIQWREFSKQHTIAGEEEIAVIREFIQESGRSL